MSRPVRSIGRSLDVADDDLVARLGGGDLDALGRLYDRHAAGLARLASRLGAAADTEDVVHAVFVRVVDLAPRFAPGRGSVRAWLAGITVKVVRERRRSLARWLQAMGALAREPQGETAKPGSTRVDVLRALAELPAAQREAVILVDGTGLTSVEAAEALGVPIGTIWSRLHHGRAALRARLGDER